jgi:hypothetical protein
VSIRDTTTYEELIHMSEVPALAVCWALEAKLFAGEDDVGVSNVLSHMVNSNYRERYYGDNMLTIQLDTVAYKKATENNNNLTVELTKAQVSADGLIRTEVRKPTRRYKAFMTESPNIGILALNDSDNDTGGTLGQLGNLVTVTLQLIEPVVRDLRFAETGGIFKNVTLEQVLKITLGYELPEVAIKTLLEDESYTGIRGVDVIPPDNQRVYKHVIIPNGTRLVNIPKILQETYGIYATELGWHIEKQRCFVYPLLRNVDYGKRHNMLTILNVPVDEIPIMERTFMVRENQVYVFATGDTAHYDNVERVQNNAGNGIRFSRATDLVDYMEETSLNKSTWNSSKTVKALVLDNRPDSKNNVRFVKDRITDNPYKYLSGISNGLGTTVKVKWSYSDPSLLYPGMQTKLLYKSGGIVEALDGILVGLQQITAPSSDSILNNQYIIHCELTIHLKRITEISI